MLDLSRGDRKVDRHVVVRKTNRTLFILFAMALGTGFLFMIWYMFALLSAPRPNIEVTVQGNRKPVDRRYSNSLLRGTVTPIGSNEVTTGMDVMSERNVADFGPPDAMHLHGTKLGVDKGVPLWTPTPLSKPLDQWTEEEKKLAHHNVGFNLNVSDSIPVDRVLPTDFRNKNCPTSYAGPFTPASIVITFYNEMFSPLVRTVHSILNTVPPSLMGEIILINDGSNKTSHPHLFEPLEKYVARGFPKVRLTHLSNRSGLMHGRMHGINLARYENIVVFDSHIECSPGWLEPLLDRLHADDKNVVVPKIEGINSGDFSHSEGGIDLLGHTWTLNQASNPVHIKRKIDPVKPTSTPIMAGGLFAIRRDWFARLGEYDVGLRGWGAEEMELSFKTHQCGGTLQCVPCSRVSHVFRNTKMGTLKTGFLGDANARNRKRVAAVWLDDVHREIMSIAAAPDAKVDIGDISKPLQVRKDQQCKSFAWYLATQYPELYVPDLSTGRYGALRWKGARMCFDTMGSKKVGDPLGAFGCHGSHGTQAFIMSTDGKLRLADGFDFVFCANIVAGEMKVAECDKSVAWEFVDGRMKTGDQCMTVVANKLTIVGCDSGQELRWEWIKSGNSTV